MATSIFKYIQQRIAAAMTQEEVSPTVGDPPGNVTGAPISVAGIPVPLEARIAQWRMGRPNEIRQEIRRLRSSAEDLSNFLGKYGVIPLAILPRRAWEHLCRELLRYRFFPDTANRVGVHHSAPAAQIVQQRSKIWSDAINAVKVAFVLMGLLIFVVLFLANPLHRWMIGLTVTIGVCVALAIRLYTSVRRERRIGQHIRNAFGKKDRAQKLQALFPGFCDDCRHEGDYFGKLYLAFPKTALPPDTLLALERVLADPKFGYTRPDTNRRLGIAVPVGSIHFGQNVEAFLRDPLAPPEPPIEQPSFSVGTSIALFFWDGGDNVAIIAEHGEFVSRSEEDEGALDRALENIPILS